jgi:quercetin dioxygenase-like cupin family protein
VARAKPLEQPLNIRVARISRHLADGTGHQAEPLYRDPAIRNERAIVNNQSAKIASLVVAAAVCSMSGLAGPTWGATSESGQESLAFSTPLPNVPGKSLTAMVVTFAPGASSPVRHHAGSVYAYVLTGTIRSENSATGPAREFKTGESFFEPPGSVHLSETEPASLLAVLIADDGATLTMPGK